MPLSETRGKTVCDGLRRLCIPCHCERSEAISATRAAEIASACFARLAMTAHHDSTPRLVRTRPRDRLVPFARRRAVRAFGVPGRRGLPARAVAGRAGARDHAHDLR